MILKYLKNRLVYLWVEVSKGGIVLKDSKTQILGILFNSQGLWTSLGGLIFSMIIGSIFIVISGENILEVYNLLLIEPFSDMNSIMNVLFRSTPVLITGLACAIAFKSDIFNIGVEGQLYVGGFAAVWIGMIEFGIFSFLHIPIAILAAMLAGGFWAGISGILKVKFGVHEVLSTIMMNYIAISLINYLVIDIYRKPGSKPQTYDVTSSAVLPKINPPNQLNTGLFLGLALVIIIYIILSKTPLGFELKSIGANPIAARFAGIESNKMIIIVMVLSGAVGGIAGAEQVLGVYNAFKVGFSPGYGFDGIAVALIGRNNPFGVLAAALLIGTFRYGGMLLSFNTNLPREWTMIIVSIMILFVAGSTILSQKLNEFLYERMA